ncbi:MAG TPA: serine/threonine-protein kinase, partial [Nannocystis sp.]
MGEGPQRPAGDIGSDATLDGSMLATVAPPASSAGMSGLSGVSGTSGARGPLLLQRELPADFDRSSLGERERDLVVSRYILLSRLGAGGMGLVYLAYDPSLDRKVAVKLLRPVGDGVEPAAEAHARLHREAQALAKLSHPNVVAVHDVGTYDASALYGTPRGEDSGQGVFLVMEYIEGATLAHWLEERPRSWQEVVAAFLAAGHGLVAAHAVGVIHRDFKPSNVLVRRDGSVHVFDFGLARAAGNTEAVRAEPRADTSSVDLWSSGLSSPLTQFGAFVGTPAYMAPEQRGGEEVDERSDQFSFCVALYEGLYGNRPFSGGNVYLLEMAKVTGQLDPPRRRIRRPKALHRAVVRGLAAEPRDRWPTLPAMLAELDRLLRRRRGRIVAAALAVGLLGAGAGAYAVNRGSVCTDAPAAF